MILANDLKVLIKLTIYQLNWIWANLIEFSDLNLFIKSSSLKALKSIKIEWIELINKLIEIY